MIPWEETDALRRVLVEWALRVDIPVDVLGEDVTTDDAHRSRLLLILLATRCDSLEQRGRYDEAGWAAVLGLTPGQIDHLMDILASLDLVWARGERDDDPGQVWYWIEAPEQVAGEVLRRRASGPARAATATDVGSDRGADTPPSIDSKALKRYGVVELTGDFPADTREFR